MINLCNPYKVQFQFASKLALIMDSFMCSKVIRNTRDLTYVCINYGEKSQGCQIELIDYGVMKCHANQSTCVESIQNYHHNDNFFP